MEEEDVELLASFYGHYRRSRKGKRRNPSQVRFEARLEEKLYGIYRGVKDHTWKPGTSKVFVVTKPVRREVFAAPFADRVVHHYYFAKLNPRAERILIDDCYSCRKGRGTMYGIRRLDHHIRSCSNNYAAEAYVLKLDLSGYFMSIDRTILFNKVTRLAQGLGLEWLTAQLIFHDPTADCARSGPLSDWDGLPRDKSLFTCKPGCGLPIGNLTSQLFSNIYLAEFDDYVKRVLKVRHYGRYVDDFFLVSTSALELRAWRHAITAYLQRELGVRVHPRKIWLQSYRRGVPFLGAVLKPRRIYAGERLRRAFFAALYGVFYRMNAFAGFSSVAANSVVFRDAAAASAWKKLMWQSRATVNSYEGLMSHWKSYGVRVRAFRAARFSRLERFKTIVKIFGRFKRLRKNMAG